MKILAAKESGYRSGWHCVEPLDNLQLDADVDVNADQLSRIARDISSTMIVDSRAAACQRKTDSVVSVCPTRIGGTQENR